MERGDNRKRKRDVAANEIERLIKRQERGNLPEEAIAVLVQDFFRRFAKSLFVAVCVELLDYRTLGKVEQLSVEFKALIIQRNVWERKFKHDFPALANVEMTPYLKRYLDERSLRLEDQAGTRDWKLPSRTLTQNRSRDYTVWKRYYELLVKLPTNMQQIGRSIIMMNDVDSIAWDPSGTMLASGSKDGTIRLWNVETQEQIGQSLIGHNDNVDSIAFSSDGTMLASGSSDETIRLWNVETQEQIGQPLIGHDNSVRSVAFSPDGTLLASGSWDRTIRLWNVETHQQIGRSIVHYGSVHSIAFSLDGTMLASGSTDRTIRLWNVETHEQIGQPFRGHTSPVVSIAFSPDGTLLISGSDDRTIRLWNVETHEQIGQPFVGHTSSVFSVAFSPDGTLLVSGSSDGTMRLWNLETHEQIGRPFIEYGRIVNSVAFSPYGTMIASGSYDQTIRLWGIPPDQNTLVSAKCTQCQVNPARYAHKNNSNLMFCRVECALQFGSP